jgi:maltose/moltooligosaccharide transporter
VLLPLYLVQFLSWSGIFCLWIYAVPVIAGEVLRGGKGGPYGSAMAVVGACFALYAILGASLAFVLPRVIARVGVRLTYGLSLLTGAAGIGALGVITQPIWLLPAFAALGVAWCAMSNIPYAVVSAVAPSGRGAHMMRLFAFSTVAPQVVMTMALALMAPRLSGSAAHWVMIAGGALMGSGVLLALVFGGRFVVTGEDW